MQASSEALPDCDVLLSQNLELRFQAIIKNVLCVPPIITLDALRKHWRSDKSRPTLETS